MTRGGGGGRGFNQAGSVFASPGAGGVGSLLDGAPGDSTNNSTAGGAGGQVFGGVGGAGGSINGGGGGGGGTFGGNGENGSVSLSPGLPGLLSSGGGGGSGAIVGGAGNNGGRGGNGYATLELIY